MNTNSSKQTKEMELVQEMLRDCNLTTLIIAQTRTQNNSLAQFKKRKSELSTLVDKENSKLYSTDN